MAVGLTMNQLDAWEDQYRGDSRKCWTKVMEYWLKGDSEQYPATWEGLCSLLEDTEFSTASEELNKAVIEASSGKVEFNRSHSTCGPNELPSSNISSGDNDSTGITSASNNDGDTTSENACAESENGSFDAVTSKDEGALVNGTETSPAPPIQATPTQTATQAEDKLDDNSYLPSKSVSFFIVLKA